jgi:hypothetical protein
MIKLIKNWFKKNTDTKTIQADSLDTDQFLEWLTSNQPSTYFRLNEEEINFFKKNYMDPWRKKDYDETFLDWNLNSPYIELNYLLNCFHGEHGFIKSQDAFEYICKIYPDLFEFHQKISKENMLCGLSK